MECSGCRAPPQRRVAKCDSAANGPQLPRGQKQLSGRQQISGQVLADWTRLDMTENSERNSVSADSSRHLAASREDTLQAMLREIEDDEGLQALSEEARQAESTTALDSALHRNACA